MVKLKKQISKILIFILVLSNFTFLSIDNSYASKGSNFSGNLDGVLDETRNDNKTDGIIIKFKKSKFDLKNKSSIASVKNIFATKGLNIDETISEKNLSSFKIKDKSISLEKLVKNLKQEDYIEHVQLNYKYKSLSIDSNDSHKDNLWGFDNFGQSISGQIGYTGSDISWNKATKIFSGLTNTSSTGVIVAVLDSGVAYNHPDLINQMWDGTSCKDENGTYLGNCIHGYDFADNDKNPSPLNEAHGTHVAGTIAASFHNSTGIVGVNPNAKIMVLRMGDSSFSTLTIIKSIYFAKQNGAKIINASFGAFGTGAFDEIEYEAIKDFTDNGGLFIAAAGNETGNNDSFADRFFPASFGITNYVDSNGYLTGTLGAGVNVFTGIANLISVAATDNRDNIASFSNFGQNTVSIGAPGVSIYSTILSNIVYFTGSNISDFVTGGLNNSWGKDGNGYIWTDMNANYLTGADTYIEKSIDISSINSPNLNFTVWCDAAKSLPGLNNYSTDYASLSFSTGGNFSEYAKYNYTSSNLIYGDLGGYYNSITIPLETIKSTNFKFRFSWHTDNISDSEYGCFFTNIKLKGNDNGSSNSYGFLNGTSMASPNVAGLASLAWSYKPSLNALDIKNAILNNGDSINSLSGITTTGKRINAFKTLLALSDTGNITQLKAYSNSGKTNELASSGVLNNPILYLEWQDSTNVGAIEKYKVEIKDVFGNLLETNYVSGASLNTSEINLGSGVLNLSYTGTSLKYIVSPILYDGREGLTSEINFIYDYTNPTFSSINYSNNSQIAASSVNLTGSIFDSNLSGTLLINGTGVSINSSGIFSKSIDLVPGVNHINLSVADKAGNNTSTGIDLIRIGTSPIINSSISRIGNIKLEFNSDFTATGVFIYGTGGNLNNTATGNYLDYHTLDIPYINDEETYYYRAYYLRDGYESLFSNTGTIITPKTINLSVETGSLISTGTLNISNASSTGVIIAGTGTIKLYDATGLNYIEIPRGLNINAGSGNWNKIIHAPNIVTSSGNINLSGYTRILDKTFKIGSDSDSLIFSGGNVLVNLNLNSSYNGKILKVYRSDDNQSNFTYISDCTVSSSKCTFYTNSFSEFALLESIPISSTTFSSGGGGGGGSTVSTCLDSELVCTNGIYYRKSGVNCNNGNLGKSCTIFSTGITSTGTTNTGLIIGNNLQNLIDKINQDPSLNKTYAIQSTNLKDIDNHFSKKYVDELISRKIIKGYADNTFKPDNAITRAEYLSILMKALNISVDSSLVKSSYSDIESGSWIVKYTEKAKTDFDISAKSDKFRPNDFITRAEALAMLFKISKLSLQTSFSNTFADSDLETWMTKYIIKAKSMGLVKGQDINGKAYFKPNSNITRAETSKIVVNLLKIMGK